MKNISYLIAIFFLIGLFSFYHISVITVLKTEVTDITEERDSLRSKINLIEENLMGIGKSSQSESKILEKKVSRPKKNTLEVVTNVEVDKNNVKLFSKDYESISEKDITLGSPNRTGQDLVNSLKLKTEL